MPKTRGKGCSGGPWRQADGGMRCPTPTPACATLLQNRRPNTEAAKGREVTMSVCVCVCVCVCVRACVYAFV